jgi:hypothetical protein
MRIVSPEVEVIVAVNSGTILFALERNSMRLVNQFSLAVRNPSLVRLLKAL